MALHRIGWLLCLTSLAERFVPRGSRVRTTKEMSHHTKHAVLYVSDIRIQKLFFFFLSSLQLQGRSFVRFVLMDYSTLCHKSGVFSFLVPGVLDDTSKSSGLLVLYFKFEIV